MPDKATLAQIGTRGRLATRVIWLLVLDFSVPRIGIDNFARPWERYGLPSLLSCFLHALRGAVHVRAFAGESRKTYCGSCCCYLSMFTGAC
jgi:hypothetical protein